MPPVIDIEREMAPLTFLEERHADSSEDDLAAAFATLAVYRDGETYAEFRTTTRIEPIQRLDQRPKIARLNFDVSSPFRILLSEFMT